VEEDFEALFNDILNNNDFGDVPVPEGGPVTIQDIAEVLETTNVASAILSQNLYDAIEDKENYAFPDEAVETLRSYKVLGDHLAMLLADECTCDDEEDEEEDG
jgi:hypothetical protein